MNKYIATPNNFPNRSSFLSKFLRSYLIGGISGCFCVCIVQPIEMIKVQIQAYSEKIGKSARISSFNIIRNMLFNGKGLGQFYRGLDAAFIFQMTYTATRMGIYRSMFHSYKMRNDHVPFHVKSSLALFSGFLGGLIGSPADLVMVRQQLDSTLAESQRRNYRNALDAFKRIRSEEGLLNLWRGSHIVITRAMVLNSCLLGPFDEIKERLMAAHGSQFALQARLVASAFASLCCSVVTLPIDNAKTKIQKMVPNAAGVMPYRGLLHCMGETIRAEGFRRMWTGFGPYFSRLFPHGILILLIQDYIYEFLKK